MSYVIPPINSKGTFELAVPFDNILSPIEEYTVTALRSLNELLSDDPLKNIYEAVGLGTTELDADLKNNVPIVVLVSTGGGYVYVPANKFLTMPMVTGIKHQERLLTIPLGLLPSDFDLNILKTTIEDTVYETCGTKAESVVIDNSAVVLLSSAETKRLELLRENRITVFKSFKIKYEETLELLQKKIKQIEGLERYIKKNK